MAVDEPVDSRGSIALALAVAIDAGSVAETAVRALAAPPRSTGAQRWPFLGIIGPLGLLGVLDRWQTSTLATPPADQVRRTCERLDELAHALDGLASYVDDQALTETRARAEAWSDRLWAKSSAGTEIYNDVRATMALLGRYQTNLILKRPLTG